MCVCVFIKFVYVCVTAQSSPVIDSFLSYTACNPSGGQCCSDCCIYKVSTSLRAWVKKYKKIYIIIHVVRAYSIEGQGIEGCRPWCQHLFSVAHGGHASSCSSSSADLCVIIASLYQHYYIIFHLLQHVTLRRGLHRAKLSNVKIHQLSQMNITRFDHQKVTTTVTLQVKSKCKLRAPPPPRLCTRQWSLKVIFDIIYSS